MFKKILLLTAAIVTSSFATWDYFGLLQNNSGSVKTGLYYDWDGDWSQMGLKVGARVNIVPQFELSFQSFGYQFWGEKECDEDNNCGYADGGKGLRACGSCKAGVSSSVSPLCLLDVVKGDLVTLSCKNLHDCYKKAGTARAAGVPAGKISAGA